MPKNKIGILGGSFNPIHVRHMELGRAARDEFRLDEVIFLPTGNPPHKREGLESAEHRYRMAELSVFGMKNCSVSHMELDREGIIYTADTLSLLHEQYRDTVFYYIVGEDTLYDLPNWHTPEKAFELCRFLVSCRSTENVAKSPIVKELENRGAHFRFLSLPPMDVSSTKIRDELAKGEDPPELMPQVLEYIRIFGLYGTAPSPAGFAACYEELAASLTQKRLVHTLLVSDTARKLARAHGMDENQAALAALLHDCAKCLPLEKMQSLVKEAGLDVDKKTMVNANLLHGPAGAALAQKDYHVEDEEILRAIRYHTTGEPGMTQLEMLVFLSDKIEPSRKSYPLLDKIRAEALVSLENAMLLSLKSSMEYVGSKRENIHPLSEKTYEWLKPKKDKNLK